MDHIRIGVGAMIVVYLATPPMQALFYVNAGGPDVPAAQATELRRPAQGASAVGSLAVGSWF